MEEKQELAQLREQFGAFKQELERQKIVNERLMMESMRRKMSWLQRYLWLEVACVPFALLVFGGLFASLGMSGWYLAAMAVGLVADVSFDWYVCRMQQSDFTRANLLHTARRMERMKRLTGYGFVVGLVTLVAYFAWMAWGIWHAHAAVNAEMARVATLSAYSGIVGGFLIGLPVAYYIFRRVQRSASDVLRQIEELSDAG